MTADPLTGAAQVLAAASDHPYARFAVSMAITPEVVGLAVADAQLWCVQTPFGRIGHGLGDVSAVLGLLAQAADAALLDGVRWVNLPRLPAGAVPAGWQRSDDWDFRWTTREPPVQPGQDRVMVLDEVAAPAVNALLDLVMPETPVRPGRRLVRRFYGIWDAGTLVACAADRSSATVGVIGAVAVHPDHRRAGLGSAISAALTTRLRREHGLVGLGVFAGNEPATRVYERLGYRDAVAVTSLRPQACQDRADHDLVEATRRRQGT
ncbi:MAG: GNAT family N-acetyltransferase [Micromonosporaceae bacterium]